MAEEIEKFDPSKLMEGVKDRIKATFVSMIPDDRWEELVKQVVDGFFTARPGGRYSGDSVGKTQFEELVHQELTGFCRTKLKAILESDEFSRKWNGGEYVMSEKLMEKMIELAPKMFVSMMAQSVDNVRNQIASQLATSRY